MMQPLLHLFPRTTRTGIGISRREPAVQFLSMMFGDRSVFHREHLPDFIVQMCTSFQA